MRKDRNQIDPSKPALIVTYGSCPGKARQLDRELLVVGRAPACDLVLNSPEVSPVHCLIVKTSAGWLLRNTNPRSGTHLNGESVHDAWLSDDDSLQVGTFTFKVHLPPTADEPGQPPVAELAVPELAVAEPADEPRAKRLLASRQKLVRRAWGLRRRLLQQQPLLQAERQALAQRQTELEQRTVSVDARQRECENLLLLLEEQENEVNDQRHALLDAAAAFETLRGQTEQEIARKVAEAEARVQAAEEQCRARQLEAEQLAARLQEEAREGEARRAAAAVPDGQLDALRVENKRLKRQLEQAPLPAPADHDALWAEVERLRTELHSREEALRNAEASLRELEGLRAEIAQARRLLAEIEEAPTDCVALDAPPPEPDPELDAELEALRERLERRDEELRQAEASLHDLEALRADNARLQQQAAGQEGAVQKQADLEGQLEPLRTENEELHQRVTVLGNVLQEKMRLQTRLDEQRQELVAARERLHAKDDELRRFRIAVTTPTVATAPDAQEQAELVAAVETLLRENDEFRQRLLDQAQALRVKTDAEELVAALQAEAEALRAQLQADGESTHFGDQLPAVKDETTPPIQPNQYVRQENEDLKARLAGQEAALRDQEQLRQQADSLRAENEALRGRLDEQQDQLAEATRVRAEADSRRQPVPAANGEHLPPLADDERQGLTARIAELQDEIANMKDDLDPDNRAAYEARLAGDRRTLLDERGRLEQELVNLRADRQELDAAAGIAELQIAKERVQIARDLAELNRKREEFRMEMENEKRQSIRDNLDRVRRLKEETQVKRAEPLSALVAARIGERRNTE